MDSIIPIAFVGDVDDMVTMWAVVCLMAALDLLYDSRYWS